MDCNKADKISKIYELGEVDYFQRKDFESHVKNCSRCKKKYKELIILSILFQSSKKVHKKDYFKAAILAIISKVLLTVFVGSAGIMLYTNIENNPKKLNEPVLQSVNNNININNPQVKKNKKVNSNTSSIAVSIPNTEKSTINIKVSDNGQNTVELLLDQNSLEIKDRKE